MVASESDLIARLNRLAWLYAKKRVNLKKGLKFAKATVAAFPKRHDYLDTLAEVHYSRENAKLAVETIKTALELSPDSSYYIR